MLSRVLLMNEASFVWLILVPRRTAVKEIYQLNETDQAQLQIESVELGRGIMQEFNGDKLNIAALGNLVPQLHLHHIVRHKTDQLWPNPVWGNFQARPYNEQHKAETIERIKDCLSLNASGFTPC